MCIGRAKTVCTAKHEIKMQEGFWYNVILRLAVQGRSWAGGITIHYVP